MDTHRVHPRLSASKDKQKEMAGKREELRGGPTAKKRRTSAKATDDVPLVLDKGALASLFLSIRPLSL